MSNDYFDSADYNEVVRDTLARAGAVNNIFAAVVAGFDRLPEELRIKQGRVTYAEDIGAADAYLVSLPHAPSAYTAGLTIRFKPANTNTGAATIDVNGLGVKAIKRYDGAAAKAGDIPAGAIVEVAYDGADFRIVGAHGASETNAAASAAAAATSETNAAGSAAAAGTSESNAASSEGNASASATEAANWANTAENILVPEGDQVDDYSALHHAAKAGASASAAATSETNAGTSETNAAGSASAAAVSETNAATSEANAEASEAAAAGSAVNAAASETAAATSETNAATSEANALGHYQDFLGVYYGALADDPLTDPNGAALNQGDWYFNTTNSEPRLYDGSAWSTLGASTAKLEEFTLTAGQTTVSPTGGYTSGFVTVTLNGVALADADFDDTNGTDIVLAEAGADGDILRVLSFGTFDLANHYTKAESDDLYYPLTQDVGLRNKLINGGFDVWQRGTSFTASGAGYTADRWRYSLSGGVATVSRQDFALGQTDVPGEPKHYLRFDVTTGNDFCSIEQRIEDVRTFAGQTVTVSFYAKGVNPGGGSIDLRFYQEFGAGAGASPVVNTIPPQAIVLTPNWTRYTATVAIPSISGKTIDGDSVLQLTFEQPEGDVSTAAWQLDIANVQIEEGPIATPFERRPLGLELSLCQRYFVKSLTYIYRSGTLGNTASGNQESHMLPVVMRALPAMALIGTAGLINITSVILDPRSEGMFLSQPEVTTTGAHARYGFNFEADAEL